MKKKFTFLILMITILFITMFFIIDNIYKSEFNKKIYSLINNVHETYPDMEDDTLIELLKKENLKTDYLNKYNYTMEDNLVASATKKISLVFTLFLLIVLLSIIYYNYRTKKNIKYELNKLLYILREINNKNYSLNIEENKENEFSILSKELYDTMIILKNSSEINKKDKLILKDNIANISHQLKTPLTSINIMLDNIIEKPDMKDEMRNEFLEDIRIQLNNINFLIINLLKLSKFDANVIKFNRKNIKINDILNKSINNLSYQIKEKNIEVLINDNDFCFECDLEWEVEAYTNIIKNAIEHSNNNGKIFIDVKKSKYLLKINIKDMGIGIEENDLKNIFKRFYKCENSSINSFGIGLNLALEIIKKDNGSIKVKSKKNKGTEFLISYLLDR